MSNEDTKNGGDPLLPPPPPSIFESVGLRSRGGGKESPLYIQDNAPAEDVRRSKSSGCWLCGCDADHDVIPPASTIRAPPTATISNNRRGNEVTDMAPAPDLFPSGAGAVVDYLKTNGFPTGLCKTLVNLEVGRTNLPIIVSMLLFDSLIMCPCFCSSLGVGISTLAHRDCRLQHTDRDSPLSCH